VSIATREAAQVKCFNVIDAQKFKISGAVFTTLRVLPYLQIHPISYIVTLW